MTTWIIICKHEHDQAHPTPCSPASTPPPLSVGSPVNAPYWTKEGRVRFGSLSEASPGSGPDRNQPTQPDLKTVYTRQPTPSSAYIMWPSWIFYLGWLTGRQTGLRAPGFPRRAGEDTPSAGFITELTAENHWAAQIKALIGCSLDRYWKRTLLSSTFYPFYCLLVIKTQCSQ